MSIIVRAFNFWTHVSAESTAAGTQIYLSAGSWGNLLAEEENIKKYRALEKKFRPQTKIPQQFINADNIVVINPDDKTGTLSINIGSKQVQLPFTVIKKDQDSYVFLIDKALAKEKLQPPHTYLTSGEISIVVNMIVNYQLTRRTLLRTPQQTEEKYYLEVKKLPYFSQVEVIDPNDKITLPTLQDNFFYGLDEIKFYQHVAEKVNPELFSRRKNNCADYVISSLQAANDNKSQKLQKLATKIYIHLGIFKIRNPNIWILGKTVSNYARAIREEILNETIQSNQLSIQDKVEQVLRMEITRLEDGIHNIGKNSSFALFRSYSKHQKIAKMLALKGALECINDDQSANDEINKLLAPHSVVLRGIFRHRTADHLHQLQDAISISEKISSLHAPK